MRNVNWEALTAIAELVGAAGVVVSLIYVASEINQNTRQVEEATRVERLAQLDATFEHFSKQRMLFATDPDVVRVLLTGMEDPDALSPVEQFQFENLLGEFLHASQLLFARAEEGVMYEEVWDNLLFGLEPFLRRPAVTEFWTRQKPEFRSAFALTVDSLIAATVVGPGEASDSTP